MRVSEIISSIYCIVATIKIQRGKSYATTRTIIFDDGMSQARALLIASYGEKFVPAISRINDSKLGCT